MELENNFTVPAGIDATWQAFNDPEMVAPCFPGATLQSFEGDSFTGTVKVKLGPISLTYKGKGTFVERDEANHRIVIDAQGRDSRGNGTAGAVVTGTLTPQGDSETAVKMITDMTITGRPAQFGRGMISDVSDRIVGQFSAALAERLRGATEAAEPAAEASTSSDSAQRPSPTVRPAPAAQPSAASNGTFRPRASEVEAIDLLDTAGAPLLKRLIPVLTGVAAVLVALLLRGRRRRRRSGA